MAELRCVDGSVLTVLPVPCVGRDGVPYEVTLRLLRDGALLGEVGERCGFFLSATAGRLRAARAHDPDAFPASGVEAGLRAWAADNALDADDTWPAMSRYLPRDHEVFAFRSRDPDDLAVAGELRVVLRDQRSWLPPSGPTDRGRWEHICRAVVEAWGSTGVGLRAVLDGAGLLAFLDALLAECAAVGAPYDDADVAEGLRRPVG